MSDQRDSGGVEVGGSHEDHGRAVGDVDQRILRFMACHPLVPVSHVQGLLGVEEPVAAERLRALGAAGLTRPGPRLRYQQGAYQITALGLREIGSELPVPRDDLRRYWQEIGAAWLWLAARKGSFGKVERVYSAREMRAADHQASTTMPTIDPAWSPAVRAKAADSTFGIRLDGEPPSSAARLHYPALMLVVPQGRVAIELQLTPPGRRPLEAILTAYALKPSTEVVLYLVQDGAIGAAVQAAAAGLGLSRPVRVQRARLDLAAY